MKPQFEKLTSGDASFLTFERKDPQFSFRWHYHAEYELTLIVDSHGQRLVGDGVADYGPGDLVLLGPNLPHSWRSGPVRSRRKEVHRAVVVQFREDFLGDRFFSLNEMQSVSRLLQRSSNGLAFGHTAAGRRVARELEHFPHLPAPKRLIALLSALQELANTRAAQELSSSALRLIGNPADQQRIDAICKTLNDSFRTQISHAELAKRFRMDQASLCRFFKHATGRTITDYVTELRVAAAAQLLIETDKSTLDICFESGFGNYSNFSRQFKRLKAVSPREMRRNFAEAPKANAKFTKGQYAKTQDS